jgi:hypothetical protein
MILFISLGMICNLYGPFRMNAFNGYQGFHVPVGTKYANKFACLFKYLTFPYEHFLKAVNCVDTSQSNGLMPQRLTCGDCLSFDVCLFGSVFQGVSGVSWVQGGVKPNDVEVLIGT